MNLNSNLGKRWLLGFWIGWALATLIAWPVVSHLSWLKSYRPLHGVPAFFLGLVVFIVIGAIVRLVMGMARQGLRWLNGKEAIRVILGALALVISAVALFYTLELWRGKRAWAYVVAAAERQGQSLDPKRLIPATAPVDQDFGRAPLFAPLDQVVLTLTIRDADGNQREANLGPLTNVISWPGRWNGRQSSLRLASWLERKPTDLIPWLKLCSPLVETNQAILETNAPAVASMILRNLESFDSLLRELRAYSARPLCQLPFNYASPYFADNCSERVLTAFMRLLRLRATAALALDRIEPAFQDLQLTLRLAEFLRQQPGLYYQTLRAYAFADGLQPLWEGMVAHRWNAAQLQTIQRQLREFHPLADYPNTLRFLAFANAGFVESIIPTTTIQRSLGSALPRDEEENLRWVRRCYPVGWSLQDQAAIYGQWLQTVHRWTESAPQSLANSRESDWVRELIQGTSDPLFPVFMVPKIVQMQRDPRECLPFAQTVAHLAMVACALEQYYLTNRAYPPNLAALTPGLIEPLPKDVMAAAPLHYRRNADRSFVLYSVGLNGADDQGQPSPRCRNWNGEVEIEFNLQEKDWVWTSESGAP